MYACIIMCTVRFSSVPPSQKQQQSYFQYFLRFIFDFHQNHNIIWQTTKFSVPHHVSPWRGKQIKRLTVLNQIHTLCVLLSGKLCDPHTMWIWSMNLSVASAPWDSCTLIIKMETIFKFIYPFFLILSFLCDNSSIFLCILLSIIIIVVVIIWNETDSSSIRCGKFDSSDSSPPHTEVIPCSRTSYNCSQDVPHCEQAPHPLKCTHFQLPF